MAKPDTRIASTDESLLSEPDDLRPAEADAKEDDPRDTRTFFRGRLLGKVRAFLNENGPLAAMFAVVFVNLVGFGIVVPLMPFFAQSLQAQAWQVT